jgi:hypothetical protein
MNTFGYLMSNLGTLVLPSTAIARGVDRSVAASALSLHVSLTLFDSNLDSNVFGLPEKVASHRYSVTSYLLRQGHAARLFK